jgi:hypothetical protein
MTDAHDVFWLDIGFIVIVSVTYQRLIYMCSPWSRSCAESQFVSTDVAIHPGILDGGGVCLEYFSLVLLYFDGQCQISAPPRKIFGLAESQSA